MIQPVDQSNERRRSCTRRRPPLDQRGYCAICAAQQDGYNQARRESALEQLEDGIWAARRNGMLSDEEIRAAVERCLAVERDAGAYVLSRNAH